MNKPFSILLLASLLMIMMHLIGCTCDESSGFSNFQPYGWVYGDTVYFKPGENAVKGPAEAMDSTAVVRGDMTVVVRHSNNYEYSNLWLEIRYQSPDSIVTDTVNIRLADDFGNWLGKGTGVSYQQSQQVLDDVVIAKDSSVRISHIMRVDTLPNIEQIGVVFVPN